MHSVAAMVIMLCGVAVMVAVIAPHGAIAVVVVVISSWPHYHRAIRAWQLDFKKRKLVEKMKKKAYRWRIS